MAKTGCGGIKAREFDDVLTAVGSFGRYQKLRVGLIFLPVSLFIGFASTSFMFEMVVPPHWCHVPGRENTTLTPEEWKNLTIPTSDEGSGKYSSCQMYDGYFETVNGNSTYIITNNTKECSHGWEFDRNDFIETDPSAHEWVCGKAIYAHHSLSLNLAGRAVGTFLLPMIADNFMGRRRMFYVAVSTYIIFTLPLYWLKNPSARLLFRFLQGTGFETNYLMPYAITLETIPPARRDATLMLTFVAWPIGMSLMSLVAWWFGHWKTISGFSLLPMLICFFYWRLLPESPRWLLSKGRLRECADILLKIGADNSSTTTTTTTASREEVEAALHELSLKMPPNEPLTRVFKYPKLRFRVIMLCLLSFTQFLLSGTIVLSMTVMPGNYFASHLLLSLCEIPAVLAGLAAIHYFGRRFLGYFCMVIGACCLIAAPFYVDHTWTLIGIMVVAKMTFVCTLFIVFLLPSEILPTPIRTSGAGLCVVTGMMAMSLSPYLLNSPLGPGFTYGICLGVAVVGAIALAPLPETLSLAMPQTFQDAEELGRGRPLTAWIHHWNVHKFPSSARQKEEDVEEEEGLVKG